MHVDPGPDARQPAFGPRQLEASGHELAGLKAPCLEVDRLARGCGGQGSCLALEPG